MIAPVAGVDEVGRGPLAGPVVAAAVVVPRGAAPLLMEAGLDDSKRLTAAKRAALCALVAAHCQYALGAASVGEIDSRNILAASLLAMQRAVLALPEAPSSALVDGNRLPPLPCAAEAVVGGDAKCLSIAAASVVAKVTRDRLMAALGARYPVFGWERNAGYGTKEHRAALDRHGPTPHHRTSFAPVAQFSLALAEKR